MVKVMQADVPPEWEELWSKIVKWFGRFGVPTYVANWFQTTRSMYDNKIESQKISEAAESWKTLNAETKYQWKLAAYRAYGYYRSTRLFNADYIYRKKVGLSLPGTPSLFHQLFGLRMSNPNGSGNIYFDRDDKDIVGKINLRFTFKKIENVFSADYKFQVKFIGYYFTEGSHYYDTNVYTADDGNIEWNLKELDLGVVNRNYYHTIIRFTIANYNAIVYLDNIRIRDNVGVVLDERFNVKDYGEWEFDRIVRKYGWFFNPKYDPTYFNHEYLID